MSVFKKDMSCFVLVFRLDTPEPCMMLSQKGKGAVISRRKDVNCRDWFSFLFEAIGEFRGHALTMSVDP